MFLLTMRPFVTFLVLVSILKGGDSVGSNYNRDCGALTTACASSGDKHLICLRHRCSCEEGYEYDETSSLCQRATVKIAGYFGKADLENDCHKSVILDASKLVGDAPGGNFKWYCAFEPLRLPQKSTNGFIDSNEDSCFGATVSLTDNTAYFVRGMPLFTEVDKTYYFKVSYELSAAETFMGEISVLLIQPTKQLKVAIKCISNCLDWVCHNQDGAYKAECTNCPKQMEKFLAYKWTLIDSRYGNKKDLDLNSRMATLSILPYTLRMGNTYRLTVDVTLVKLGFSEQGTLALNVLPGIRRGFCELSPLEGDTETNFTVTCSGYQSQHPLRYTLEAEMANGETTQIGHEQSESLWTENFPIGLPEKDYMLRVAMKVCTIFTQPICMIKWFPELKVTATQDTIDRLKDEMGKESQGDHMDDYHREEANEKYEGHAEKLAYIDKVIQDTLSLTSILNSDNLNVTNSTESRKKIRNQIISKLGSLPQVSLESVSRTASVLLSVTNEKDELSMDSIALGAEIMTDLTAHMDEFKNNATTKQIEDGVKRLVGVVSNLISEVVVLFKVEQDASGIGVKETEENHRGVTLQLMEALNSVSQILAGSKVAGDPATIIKTNDLALFVEKHVSSHLVGLDIAEDAGIGNISKPAKFTLPKALPIPSSDEIVLKTVRFKDNPYIWTQSASLVKTDVNDLQMKSGDATVSLRDIPHPIRIVMPHNKVDKEPPAYNLTLRNVSSLLEFKKTSDKAEVLLYINRNLEDDWLMEDAPIYLALYDFSFDDIDPLDDDVKRPIFNTTYILGKDPIYQMLDIHIIGTYTLELLVNESYLLDNATIKVSTSQISCLYWVEKQEQWVTDGCLVGQDSTLYEFVCYCNHLTSFAGGFIVMPNKINFKEALAQFAHINENPVGIITCCIVLVIYVIAVLLARWKDKRDYIKGAVVNLADNDPDHGYNFIVSIQTGSRRNAGTTANVVCVIIGEQGECLPHVLFSSSNVMCQRGRMDTFIIRTKHTLGTVTHLKLWHDNYGDQPEWFVSYVELLDCELNEKYYFVFNCWLAENLGDGHTLKSLPVATKKEKTDLEFLFFTNANVCLKDYHLWISTSVHPPESIFTTVQRVSCCLCLFMMYMLCNIMFYGIEPESGGEQKLELGVGTITWTAVKTGVFSCMISFPITVLVIFFFNNRRLRHPRAMYHVHPDSLQLHLTQQAGMDNETYEETVALANEAYKTAAAGSVESMPSITEGQVKDQGFEMLVPWWFIIVGWVFVFLVVVTCGFFTMLYSFTYGYEKSVKWVISVFTAFTTDAFLAQPVKVILLAAIFSIIFKATLTESQRTYVNLDHTIIRHTTTSTRIKDLRQSMPVYSPPYQYDHTAELIKKRDDTKVYNLFYEILRYLVFLYLVLLITYSKQDVANQYFLNHLILEQVVFEDKMMNVTDITSTWEYISTTLVSGLFDKEYPEYINNIRSIRLSPPLLMQTRKPKCTAEPNDLLKKLGIKKGHHWNCLVTEKETNNFGVGWEHANLSTSAWLYNKTYKGYVVELGATFDEATSVMEALTDNLWMDKHTTSIAIKCVSYHPQLNLLSIFQLTFKLNNPVGIIQRKDLESIKLYRSTYSFAIFVYVLEFIYAGYSIYFAIYVIRQVKRQKLDYFVNVWSCLDICVVIISFNVIVVYICHVVYVLKATETYVATGDVYLFDKVLMFHYYVQFMLALLVCCSTLKFLHMLRFNPNIFRFLAVLNRSKNGLFWSCSVLVLVLFQYGGMFHIMAAGKSREFRTVRQSILSMFLGMMGKYDVATLSEIDPTLGPVAMFMFMISSTVLGLNLMTSVLIESLTMLNKEGLPYDEARLLEVLLERCANWLGVKKRGAAVLLKRGPPEQNQLLIAQDQKQFKNTYRLSF